MSQRFYFKSWYYDHSVIFNISNELNNKEPGCIDYLNPPLCTDIKDQQRNGHDDPDSQQYKHAADFLHGQGIALKQEPGCVLLDVERLHVR